MCGGWQWGGGGGGLDTHTHTLTWAYAADMLWQAVNAFPDELAADKTANTATNGHGAKARLA